MKSTYEDKELKKLFKSLKPESPGVDFSARLMNRIFEEQAALEQVKKEPVLGKSFWTILALFAGLFLAVILLSGNVPAGEGASNLLNGAGAEAVSSGYESFFEKLGAVPGSVAGILFASSLLLFLEKFLQLRSSRVSQ